MKVRLAQQLRKPTNLLPLAQLPRAPVDAVERLEIRVDSHQVCLHSVQGPDAEVALSALVPEGILAPLQASGAFRRLPVNRVLAVVVALRRRPPPFTFFSSATPSGGTSSPATPSGGTSSPPAAVPPLATAAPPPAGASPPAPYAFDAARGVFRFVVIPRG